MGRIEGGEWGELREGSGGSSPIHMHIRMHIRTYVQWFFIRTYFPYYHTFIPFFLPEVSSWLGRGRRLQH